MKTYTVYILIFAAVVGIVSTPRILKKKLNSSSEAPRIQVRMDAAKIEDNRLKKDVRSETVSNSEPLKKEAAPVKAAAPIVAERSPPKPVPSRMQDPARRYWERQAQQFDRQREQLVREEDPIKRTNLIRSMSRYVRVDTLSAIDWAMSMGDPAEQRAALEAVNANSLSGIGARIEIGKNGLPRIRETTVLSAVAATGQVEAGDYIVGMEDGTGQAVFFEGLSASQVVQVLRGKPGTPMRLMMERAAVGGSPSYPFDVTIRRSLLVVLPPF